MLAILLAIRLAGDKSPRNFLQTITLALFCLAASTLFDLSPSFVIYLLLLLLIFTVSLVLLTFQSRAAGVQAGPKRAPRHPHRCPAAAADSAAADHSPLFRPAANPVSVMEQASPWREATDRESATRSSPATKALSAAARRPCFAPRCRNSRRKISTGAPWCSILLKGSSWVRKEPPGESKVSAPAGRAIQQTIYLEPNRIRYLPALDLPQSLSGARGEPSADRLYAPSRFTAGRRSYGAFSRPDGMLTEKSLNKRFYTTLPANIPAGLTRISAESATARTDTERLRRIQDAFRKLRLSYSVNGAAYG